MPQQIDDATGSIGRTHAGSAQLQKARMRVAIQQRIQLEFRTAVESLARSRDVAIERLERGVEGLLGGADLGRLGRKVGASRIVDLGQRDLHVIVFVFRL